MSDMKLILLGAPGAGKGTQAAVLSSRLCVPTISTGSILRTAINNGTPIGLEAEKYIKDGKLVPDEIIIGIVRDRLAEEDCKDGYILDGVPRTLGQADAMEQLGIDIDIALSIEISDDTIIDRLSGRKSCIECSSIYHISSNPPKFEGVCDQCGGELITRGDDQPEIIRKRLNVYHEETEPLKTYYDVRGKLRFVDNKPTIEDTTIAIVAVLGL